MGAVTSYFQEEQTTYDEVQRNNVEVLGDSIEACVSLAASHFGKKPHEIDYRILKRGKKSFFFLFSEPFHIRARVLSDEELLKDLAGLDEKLTGGSGKLLSTDIQAIVKAKDRNGRFVIKHFRNGVFLTVYPPLGEGNPVKLDDISRKLSQRGVAQYDQDAVRVCFKDAKGEPLFISNVKPRAGSESQATVEISQDKMKAFVTITPPRPGGKDLDVSDIIAMLKHNGVVYGVKEKDIKEAIDEEKYNYPFLAAEGDEPQNGRNAEVKYYVRTEKVVNFKEDSFGRVDYKDLDLIENVVAGQVLAEKIPRGEGKLGRNLFGMMLPADDGKDIDIKVGKGTILSEDRMKLTAEINGQVVYASGKISVEKVYRINGDVGIKTGNVTFLGSIVISGNVEDNYHVKAAGNIEIFGVVQKAVVEADGDIIIRQGVTGRGEARIESTGGNIVSRFIQNASCITEKDIVVQEGIVHSEMSAGGRILCKGKRGQIVGGTLQATKLIYAKVIGSQANPPTDIIVGSNPKLLKQIVEYELKKKDSSEKLAELSKSLKTLLARKDMDKAAFSDENESHLQKLQAATKKLEKRITDLEEEIIKLQQYIEEESSHGKVSVEKTVFGGVNIRIKKAEFRVRNEVKNKTFYEEGGFIKQMEFESLDEEKKDWRKKKAKNAISKANK